MKLSGGEEEEVSSDLPTSTTDHETHNNNLNLLMFRTPSFGDDSYDLITDRPENFNFTDDIIKNSKIADSPFLPTISSTDISAFLEPNPRDHEVHFSSSESDNFSDNRSLPTISVTSAVSQQYQNQVVPSNSSLQLAQQQQRKYISPLTSQNSLLSRMMSMPRDSILDTLESIAPKFPPQDVDLPDISVTNGLQTAISSAAAVSSGFHSSQIFGQTNITGSSSVTLQTGALTSSVSAPGMTGSPTGSSMSNVSNATPLESSEDSDDSVPLAQLVKRQAEDLVPTPTKPKPAVVKKPRVPKKKKKKDPNEPQKPVSAYALFFRDTQAAIKGQNPNATFGEVSKIVASMWEGLDPDHKDAYKKRTENAKKEYLKQLAAYRANMVSQVRMDESPSPPRRSPPGTSPQHMMGYMNNISPQHMGSPAHMGNPAHMGSPAHLSSPMHAQSPQHISSPHHVTSPQHMSSPQHLMGGHISSPQHMNMTSPQHNMMYDAQRVAQSPPQYNMGGYSNGGQPMDMIDNGMVIDSQLLPPTGGNTGRMMSSGMCIRTGCHNRAIDNIGWDSEYCSNECVVSHCRDVFSAWVSNRQVAPNQFTVK